ncbi:VgrG protein [Aquipluma nitroreducens]|uniref:VgrG protein n=1 Tax=Aquipluma nitroreducens TaxID=2010828 RepID=A0A5K7SGG4_9BACT|nr:type VI secretion system tip protein VgrG [Aquipluma nitroreducens]BBE20710.1 VgrG protein [Aquipluma nitroreducens]
MPTVFKESDGVLSFDILINGARIKDTVEIIEISIQMELNKITAASLVISDGGVIGLVNEPYINSEGNDFIPGNKIKISLGYDSINKPAFEGIIVSQGLSIKNGRSQLVVICKDEAVKMTKGRFNAIFQNEKDSDAIQAIAGKYGLSVTVDATTTVLPVIMQYNCSDWDFTVIRAEMNNMCVLTDKNSLIIKKIDFSQSPKYKLIASQSIIDIDLTIDSEKIAGTYQFTAWDIKQQKESSLDVSQTNNLSLGNLTAQKLSEAVDNGNSSFYSSASISESELKTWGETLSTKAELSKIQGRVTIQGVADLLAGDVVEISGFSARYNGNAFITKVSHSLQDGNWLTTLSVGKSVQLHAALPDIEEIRASGIIPASGGTQIATVKKIEEDPDGEYRVLVKLPAFAGTGQDDGIWARLAFPYASSNAGFFFFPEVGDEVLLNFINNDPRFAIITGSLYSSKNTPKEIPDNKNQFKSIFSKSGIKIRFDDEDKILNIETPGGNSFTLDDKDKKINIKDISGNSVIMDDSGITMDSPKDIKLTAKGDITISATGGLYLSANSDVKADGLNVQLSAKTGFTAKGNATAEVSASGQTTIKGGIVMIN